LRFVAKLLIIVERIFYI